MDDLNDLLYFAFVVKHNGFSAAARATGLEKTRLSRRVANLEKRLGVRLLQRSTRSIALTEAGRRFHEHCVAAVEGAHTAYESVAALRREPAGTVRISCPQVMAEIYLAPILPEYMAAHPKVDIVVDATDREVNLIEEGFDVTLRSRDRIPDTPGLVARKLGDARHILVASPAYLRRKGGLDKLGDLPEFDTLARPAEVLDRRAGWHLTRPQSVGELVQHEPRLICEDRRMLLEAARGGIGIALLPEQIVADSIKAGSLVQVLPEWSTASQVIFLLYPRPRGMLPSVRSLIDFLSIHLHEAIQEGRRGGSEIDPGIVSGAEDRRGRRKQAATPKNER